MANDYMPRSDAGMLQWMRAFADGIAAQPYAYGQSPSDGVTLVRAVDEYEAALAVASEAGTRTSVTIQAKNAARNSAEQLCRQYYSLIKPHGGVTDAMKLAIGVRPINSGRQRIDCPATSPLLEVISATPGRHTLRYHDAMTPNSRAKPFGAAMLQLFATVAAPGDSKATPSDPESAKLVGQFVDNPITVAFTAADDCKKATYFGRWLSRRGETGPWSAPASMTIAA